MIEMLAEGGINRHTTGVPAGTGPHGDAVGGRKGAVGVCKLKRGGILENQRVRPKVIRVCAAEQGPMRIGNVSRRHYTVRIQAGVEETRRDGADGDLSHGAGNAAEGVGNNNLIDRKSTRLNSSHLGISYAVF